MPNLNTTRSELEQAFITGWGATTEIAHDNSNFTAASGQPFVRINVEFLSSDNVNIGGALAGTVKQRHNGLIRLAIYVPIMEGTGAAYTLADSYKLIMDNQQIATNIFTGTSDIRRSGEEVDGFWSIICLTDFYSDEL